jgi:hypothetical protein
MVIRRRQLAKGLYRTSVGWVMVENEGQRVLLSAESYIFSGVQPEISKLPSQREWEVAHPDEPNAKSRDRR